MNYIERTVSEKITQSLFKGKATILLGSRQVGKSTIINHILKKLLLPTLYLNEDNAEVREILSNTTSTQCKNIIAANKVIFIDEAQRIENIGVTLKIITGQIKNVQVHCNWLIFTRIMQYYQ